MSRQPTIEDFTDWVQSHLDKATEGARAAIQAIERRRNAAGCFRSGGTIIAVFGAADAEVDRGIAAALGALNSALQRGQLDGKSLRQETEDRLRAFVDAIKETIKPERYLSWGPEKIINERMAQFDSKLDFNLRQFDVGHLRPQEPDASPPTGNSINIELMAGGAVQQGTSHSTQNVVINVNIEAAKVALQCFEEALSDVAVPPDVLAKIRPELDTIKAQLAKPKPSSVILAEAGRSLRNITEGAIGGILAPHAIAILSALGLG